MTALCAWSVLGPLLWWGRLPGTWRRSLAILSSVAGIGFLVVAVRSEGVHEGTTRAAFLMMGSSYVTEQTSALTSLPYYVLTGVCLLLGTLGLAVGDDLAERLHRHWLAAAVVLSLGITALRFGLEKFAAPPFIVALTGIVWLPPLLGAFFAQSLRAEGKGILSLVTALAGYALIVRGGIAALSVFFSALHLGSHYDVTSILQIRMPFSHRWVHFEPGSFRQMLDLGILPQVIFWIPYTILTGLLGASLLRLLEWIARPSTPAGAPELAAAGKDR